MIVSRFTMILIFICHLSFHFGGYRPSADRVTGRGAPACHACACSIQYADWGLLCIPEGAPHFLVQCMVMWRVLWLSPSPERVGPCVGASKRKLRGVGFVETGFGGGDQGIPARTTFWAVALHFGQGFFPSSWSELAGWVQSLSTPNWGYFPNSFLTGTGHPL